MRKAPSGMTLTLLGNMDREKKHTDHSVPMGLKYRDGAEIEHGAPNACYCAVPKTTAQEPH